jgi:hypothetical protein
MAGTECLYNKILLKNCQTLRFEQAIEYDESGTDAMFHRFLIRVSGSVHANPDYHYGADLGSYIPSSTVDAAIYIQNQLEHPRGAFEYRVGSHVLLRADSVPGGPYLDVNNGPKPRVLSITRIVGRSLFEVEFEIEVCRVYCGNLPVMQVPTHGAKRNSAVLNNRWCVTEERDKDFLTIRTLEGTLRVSHISAFPHLYRYLCVPPLQRGYKRESMRFVDSPDGLTLKYQIVDRQRYAAPPEPAIDWDATYTESSGVGGAMGFGEMAVRLTGSPHTDKKELIATAMAIIKARLGDLQKTFKQQGQGDHKVLLMNAAIVEHLHDNTIHVTARVQRVGGTDKWLNTLLDNMGKPLPIAGYDPQVWPSPKLFDGSSPVSVFAKYLQSPCIDIHGVPMPIPKVPEEDDPGKDNQSQGTVEVYLSKEPLQLDDQTGPSQQQSRGGFPYVYCLVENHYDVRDGYMQLPIARWGGAPQPAAPRPSCVMIPLHEPIGKRSIIVHAERVGDWPDLPDPFPIGTDFNAITQVRDRQKILCEVPELLADGKTRLFKRQFRLDYMMGRAPRSNELLAGGGSPVDQSVPAENAIDGSKHFVSGLYI